MRYTRIINRQKIVKRIMIVWVLSFVAGVTIGTAIGYSVAIVAEREKMGR